MSKFVVVPQVSLYPLPTGMDPATFEFDTLENATAAASAALNVAPGQPRAVCEVVSRLSAAVSVSVSTEKAAK